MADQSKSVRSRVCKALLGPVQPGQKHTALSIDRVSHDLTGIEFGARTG
jgi:hypothetical protein